MAVKLGYGGLGNTNGARDFSGKQEAPAPERLGIPWHPTIPSIPSIKGYIVSVFAFVLRGFNDMDYTSVN